jgi:hypothetical protein
MTPAPGPVTAPPALDDLVPVRRHRAVDREDGLVTVLVPKFTGRFTRRWFVPLLAKPDMRVHLDALGSFVWRQCDGLATVRAIGDRVAEQFGGEREARRLDVVRFVRKLVREESLAFTPPGAPPEVPGGQDPDGFTV